MANSNNGYCVICEKETTFVEHSAWLRDNYRCSSCNSIPRQRALINTLNIFVPNWRNKLIHESSAWGQASDYIKKYCKNYSESQFFPSVRCGDYFENVRCENLESMTFKDNSFDILITQDVFEHVQNPDLAFKEISRVLNHGGIHIFTMPWYPNQKTVQRSKVVNGKIEYLETPVYHGNPIDANGSLVTFDWGIDFTNYIYIHSNMFTTIYLHKDRKLGLDAEFLHVFISTKL